MTDKHTGRQSGQKWLAHTRRQLDDSENWLDGATLGRLRAVRREALARRVANPPWQASRYLVPGLSFALALVVVAGLNLSILVPLERQPLQNATLLEDLPILSGVESLDLIDEMEFYLWVEEVSSDLG